MCLFIWLFIVHKHLINTYIYPLFNVLRTCNGKVTPSEYHFMIHPQPGPALLNTICGIPGSRHRNLVQITFIFIDFRVCDFAFAFKTQNARYVSRFKCVLFTDRFQFAF